MVEVTVRATDVEDEPTVVEGLPGVGLVGKIAADHLIDEFGMRYYADITGEGIPPIAAFDGGEADVKAPTRLFVDEERDLIAIRGDVPISAINAPTFAADVTEWLRDRNALARYLTGFPSNREPDATPDVSGIIAGDGDGDAHHHDAGAEPPPE